MKIFLRLSLIICAMLVFVSISTNAVAKKYKMIMTNEVSATHWKTGLMKDLAKTIEERSNGRIKVKLYNSSQLYTDRAAIKALGTGAVQMVWPVSVNVETLSQGYGIISMPFAINDKLVLDNPDFRKDLLKILSNSLGQEGIKVGGILRADELVFVFKDNQPKTPKEIKGLKVRVIGGQVLLDWVGELGLAPISMPATEFTTALSQGIIDGIHTSSDGWAKMIGDLGQYGLVVPDLIVITYSMLLDQKWFDNLPVDLQEIVTTAVDELASRQWAFSMEKTKIAYKKIKNEFKATVYRVPAKDIGTWGKKVNPSYKRFADKFPNIYENYIKLNQKYGRQWPPKMQ